MKKLLKALPIPAAGVMLGLAALGNLLQSYGEGIRLFFGALAAILWVLLVLKVIFCWKGVCATMNSDPVVASVSGTFPMATMLLAVYAKNVGLSAALAQGMWYAGIALTAPAFGAAATIGTWCFWFGFVCLLALLVLVGYRYVRFPVKMDPPKPLFCIFAAPASLCLAGYIQSVASKSAAMVIGMLVLSSVLYILVLVKTPGFLKLPFYPSYAAFTFPFVITAIAAKQSMACLTKMGMAVAWLKPVVLVETVIAAVLVIYALIRYIMALAASCKTAA